MPERYVDDQLSPDSLEALMEPYEQLAPFQRLMVDRKVNEFRPRVETVFCILAISVSGFLGLGATVTNPSVLSLPIDAYLRFVASVVAGVLAFSALILSFFLIVIVLAHRNILARRLLAGESLEEERQTTDDG